MEEVFNLVELKTLQLCRQMPAHAVEARNETDEVKSLLVQSGEELEGNKAWLFARHEMAVSDPEGMDLQNRDVVFVMIVESTSVVDDVTALAEKLKELALRPWEVNLQTAIWVIQVTRMNTEVKMMLSFRCRRRGLSR